MKGRFIKAVRFLKIPSENLKKRLRPYIFDEIDQTQRARKRRGEERSEKNSFNLRQVVDRRRGYRKAQPITGQWII